MVRPKGTEDGDVLVLMKLAALEERDSWHAPRFETTEACPGPSEYVYLLVRGRRIIGLN